MNPARALPLVAALLIVVAARDDGLARTPPMGWSTWYAFGANLNETRVVQMADAIVRTGLRDAGYTLVNLDDAWLSPSRDRFGSLQGDLVRFPSGIKWLADQMHSRGLRLGLYGCPGVRTCEGYPGQSVNQNEPKPRPRQRTLTVNMTHVDNRDPHNLTITHAGLSTNTRTPRPSLNGV